MSYLLHRRLSFGFLMVCLLGIMAGAAGSARATESERAAGQSLDGGSLTYSFTYQGQLTSGGAPANGNFDFIVGLWDQSSSGSLIGTCDDVANPLTNYLVQKGIFTFRLYCYRPMNEVFNGGERWIQVQVRPAGSGVYTTLPRQPITPTPYAWGLAPYAVVGGTALSGFGGAVLNVENSGPYGYPAFYARSSSAGAAGYFANTGGGPDIQAAGTGIIHSVAETTLAINPFDIEATSELANNTGLRFLHHWLGRTEIENNTNTGSSTIFVPVSNLTKLHGAAFKLKSLEVCYDLDMSASYIDQTWVFYADNTGGRTEILSSDTNRTSTTWTCYTVTNAVPVTIDGPLLVYFNLYFSGTGASHTITIGQITATLVQ